MKSQTTFCCLLFCFETRDCSVAQTGLESGETGLLAARITNVEPMSDLNDTSLAEWGSYFGVHTGPYFHLDVAV